MVAVTNKGSTEFAMSLSLPTTVVTSDRTRSRGFKMMRIGFLASLLLLMAVPPVTLGQQAPAPRLVLQEYATPAGSYPHDAVPDGFGYAWYAGQRSGTVGRVDAATGEVLVIPIAPNSAPHGIIMGPDGALWVTDGGLNAIVRVDRLTHEVTVYPLPGERANLNTPTFDHRGVLWYTGQNGYFGRLDPAVGIVEQFDAPRGRGPYGIATAPDGTVYYASLAGSYLGRIDDDFGGVTEFDPPTPNAGVRRVWPDSKGRLWIAEYNVGQVGVFDPATEQWAEWRLPDEAAARAYAIYVDHSDKVWLSDTGNDTVVHFDPDTETFTTVAISKPSNVAQLGGVPGEVWGAQRARDHIFVVRYGELGSAPQTAR
jgi:virginiamycin B lyase